MRVLAATAVSTAAAAVDAGELVIVPTHRWYMLCGRADQPEVSDRMFRSKRRSPDRSLLLVAASTRDVADRFVLDDGARSLASFFWPGDLALLLPWRRPDDAMRMPAVGVTSGLVARPGGILGELADLAGSPIVATSANISPGDDDPGTPPAVTMAEVHQFVARSRTDVAAVIDGGVCPHPWDLTIVECTGKSPILRREGIIRERAVRAALAETGIPLTSPG